jgi:hypothetical protein
MALYKLFVPAQAVGANLVYFDLYNVGVGLLDVVSLFPVVSGAVAVTGVVAVDLFLTRTSAVGTGGTAATFEGTSLTAMTFTAVDNSQPLNSSLLSARLTPSGGATAGAVIGFKSVYSEETNAGTYVPTRDWAAAPVRVGVGTGIRIVQSSVASVGNIGFDLTLRV